MRFRHEERVSCAKRTHSESKKETLNLLERKWERTKRALQAQKLQGGAGQIKQNRTRWNPISLKTITFQSAVADAKIYKRTEPKRSSRSEKKNDFIIIFKKL